MQASLQREGCPSPALEPWCRQAFDGRAAPAHPWSPGAGKPSMGGLPQPSPGALAQASLRREGCPGPAPLKGRACPSRQGPRESSPSLWVWRLPCPCVHSCVQVCIWKLTWASFTKCLPLTFPQHLARRRPLTSFQRKESEVWKQENRAPGPARPRSPGGESGSEQQQPASTGRLESREAGGRRKRAGRTRPRDSLST